MNYKFTFFLISFIAVVLAEDCYHRKEARQDIRDFKKRSVDFKIPKKIVRCVVHTVRPLLWQRCINELEFSATLGMALPKCVRKFQKCIRKRKALELFRSYVDNSSSPISSEVEACLLPIVEGLNYPRFEPCTKEFDVIKALNIARFGTCDTSSD